jgi:hypothetical protein
MRVYNNLIQRYTNFPFYQKYFGKSEEMFVEMENSSTFVVSETN